MTETATAKRVLLDFFSHFEDDAAQCDNWAEVILADLKAARVAVIELPELYPDDAPQDVVDRAKVALAKRLCPDCGDERCGWEKHDELERAAKLVPELVAEVERAREQIRQMRRQTELFMEDGDRNRLTVAHWPYPMRVSGDDPRNVVLAAPDDPGTVPATGRLRPELPSG